MGGDPNLVRSGLGGGNANLFGTLLRVTPSGQYQVVADAGGNALIEALANGQTRTLVIPPHWREAARACRHR